MCDKVKRERCVNWEKEEKQLLRDVIRPYLPIIENKNLSTNTNKDKVKAWVEITEKFNVANTLKRDINQLKNQWKCLKLNSKKELSQYRRESAKTGGGPKPPSPSKDILEVAAMIPQEFEVDFNKFDCDGDKDFARQIIIDEKENTNAKVIPIEKNLVDIELDIDTQGYADELNIETNITEGADITTNKWPNTTPKQSAKKRRITKETHSFNFAEASFDDMHSFRAIENERMQKEHELRVKNMAEVHNQVMANLKLQNEILQKHLDSLK